MLIIEDNQGLTKLQNLDTSRFIDLEDSWYYSVFKDKPFEYVPNLNQFDGKLKRNANWHDNANSHWAVPCRVGTAKAIKEPNNWALLIYNKLF